MSVVAVRSREDPTDLTTIFAEAIRPPVESLTIPESDPRAFCADTPTDKSRIADRKKIVRLKNMALPYFAKRMQILSGWPNYYQR